MILTLAVDRPYLAPNAPAGLYRLWLWRDDARGAALVVLTELPGDPGPGLLARLGPIATDVARDYRLDAAATLWYLRRVTGPRRESIHAVEFRILGVTYYHPEYSASSRGQAEILTQSRLPLISPDEYRDEAP